MWLEDVWSVASNLVKGIMAFKRLRGLTLLVTVEFFVEAKVVWVGAVARLAGFYKLAVSRGRHLMASLEVRHILNVFLLGALFECQFRILTLLFKYTLHRWWLIRAMTFEASWSFDFIIRVRLITPHDSACVESSVNVGFISIHLVAGLCAPTDCR